jgi:hypothetical protein
MFRNKFRRLELRFSRYEELDQILTSVFIALGSILRICSTHKPRFLSILNENFKQRRDLDTSAP